MKHRNKKTNQAASNVLIRVLLPDAARENYAFSDQFSWASKYVRFCRRYHITCVIVAVSPCLAAIAHPPIEDFNLDRHSCKATCEPEIMWQAFKIYSISISSGVYNIILRIAWKLHKVICMTRMVTKQGQIISCTFRAEYLHPVVSGFP